MSTDDIFDSWKKERFIVANINDLYEGTIVVLSDVRYWTDHYDELEAWCAEYGCKVKGMTVEVPTEDLLLLFNLRWA